MEKCQNCYSGLDLFRHDNIFVKLRTKMTTVSRFSRQNDSGLRALNVILWENLVLVVVESKVGSFRFEDEDEDEALCFRQNEIFKLFRLQLGRDDEVDSSKIVTPSLSRIWACAQWAKVGLSPRSRRRRPGI